jgi:hypothetical protein
MEACLRILVLLARLEYLIASTNDYSMRNASTKITKPHFCMKNNRWLKAKCSKADKATITFVDNYSI